MAPIGNCWATGSWDDDAWATGTWATRIVSDIGRVVRMWMREKRHLIKKGM